MTHGITQAIEELRQMPNQPVIAEIEGMIVELRYRGQRTADEIFQEVGPWEGESEAELRQLIRSARTDSEKIPQL